MPRDQSCPFTVRAGGIDRLQYGEGRAVGAGRDPRSPGGGPTDVSRARLAVRPGAAGGSRHHDEVLAELRAELGLSAEQARRVQEIFAARHGEIEAAWRVVHANVEHAMRETTREIETVLDSAQIERLRAWLAARHARTPDHAPGRQH